MIDRKSTLAYRRECVVALVHAFVDVWPNSEWGGAHIALSDQNLDNGSLDFCELELQAKRQEAEFHHTPFDAAEHDAILCFINLLRLIPEEDRDIHDEDDHE